jgi:hypothetical protein
VADNTPFFIVGSGRSGTTLLRLILTGHSRIEIPPETWFYLTLVEKVPLSGPLSPAMITEAIGIIVNAYRWPDMKIDAAAFDRAVRALDRPSLADIMGIVYGHHLARAGKPRFGDKTPRYISIVPQLSTIYPGAKFIHLLRDGHDVAISICNAGFRMRWYDGADYQWTRAVRDRLAYRHTPYDARILDVRYEALIADTEYEVRRICDFLGETFEPAMHRPQERVETVPERERGIHKKLSGPVAAVGDWKTTLSPLECFLMEACLWRIMERAGYGLRSSGPALRPLLSATGLAMRALAPLRHRGIPYLQRRGHLTRWRYL